MTSYTRPWELFKVIVTDSSHENTVITEWTLVRGTALTANGDSILDAYGGYGVFVRSPQ